MVLCYRLLRVLVSPPNKVAFTANRSFTLQLIGGRVTWLRMISSCTTRFLGTCLYCSSIVVDKSLPFDVLSEKLIGNTEC